MTDEEKQEFRAEFCDYEKSTGDDDWQFNYNTVDSVIGWIEAHTAKKVAEAYEEWLDAGKTVVEDPEN